MRPGQTPYNTLYHQFLLLTEIHPHLCERLQRQKDQQSMRSPHMISSLLRFYPTLKVPQRFFTAVFNNKACTPSLNLTQLSGTT